MDFSSLAFVGLALTAGILEATHERRASIAEQVWVKADYPRAARVAVGAWLVPRRGVAAYLLYLLACIVVVGGAVVAGGAAAGLLLALLLSFFALVVGGSAGRAIAMRLGSATAQLRRLALRARTQAERFSAAGEADQNAVALAIARWIEWFIERAPGVTAATLDSYYTPKEVAGLLVDYFTRGADERTLKRWLARADVPLWAGPDEDSRVALLERIGNELVQGGGTHFADLDRVSAFVEELDRWRPVHQA